MKPQDDSQATSCETLTDAPSTHSTQNKEGETEFSQCHGHAASHYSATVYIDKDQDIKVESGRSHETDEAECDDNASDRTLMGRLRWTLLVLCIASAPFLYGFDITMVATLQPQIIESLGDIQNFSWVSVATSLGCLSTVLFTGKLCSQFNIKWLFVAYMVLFEGGCAIAGSAQNMNMMIAGRTLGGVGAMGTYLVSMHMIAAVTTIQQRPLYVVFVSVAFMVGTILGPVIGGALADSVTWRWGSYINLCMAAFLTPGYLFLFPSKTFVSDATSMMARIRNLDLLGSSLWAGATTVTVLAISFGGTNFAWNSSPVIGLLAGAVALWIMFFAQQWRALRQSPDGASQAFPLQFFRSWEMLVLFAQIFCGSVQNFLPLFLIPLYFELTRGTSAISAAYHLLPLVVLRGILVLVNGAGMRKYGFVMPWYLVGSMLCVAGSAPFLVGSPSTASVYGYAILLGIGSGMYNQASFAVAQARNPPKSVPQAITFITAGQFLGFTLPLTVSNSIFINRASGLIRDFLPEMITAMLEKVIVSSGTAQSSSSPQSFTNEPLNAEDKARVVQALAKALNDAWAVVVACAALSVILSLTMKRDRLFR